MFYDYDVIILTGKVTTIENFIFTVFYSGKRKI